MCDGGCNTSSATTAANPDAQAAYTDVVGKAQSVANTPYQPYGGELVAGLNGQQNRSIGQLANAYGAAQPYVDQGNAGLGNVQQYLQGGAQSLAGSANFGTSSAAALGAMAPYMGQVQGSLGSAAGAFGQEQAGLGAAGNYFAQAAGLAAPQSFDAAAVSQYMSPYLSSVVDATRANLNEADGQQAQRMTADAIGSGAYGGDRAAIGQAELARQQSLADGQTIAGLYNQGYANAEGQFNAVQGQRQQGASLLAGLGSATTQNALGYGNVGSGYLGAASGYNTLAQDQGQIAQQFGTLGQLGLGQASGWGSLGTLQGTTGQAYGTLGNIAQANLISGASAGLQGGTLRQQNAQQGDTAAYNQYMAGLSYPYQNVGFLSNIVQGIGSQEGNTQTTQGNALSSIAGLGTSAVGILGATGGFGANGYLSGLGSSISSAFSDARVKDDIASIGTTHDGQPIYRFRYKGDPKVQMGLMAQDVERRDPGAVGEVGGIKTVDYDRATRGAAAMGLGMPSPLAGRGAESLGMGLAARMARAAGGPVPGLSPMGGPAMPAGLGTPSPFAGQLGPGLAARPHFDDGGAAGLAPIPTAGLNTSAAGLTGGGGLNTSPSALMGGSTLTAHAAQPGLGAVRSNLSTPVPAVPQFTSAPVGAGLGTPAPSAASYTGVSQDPSSSGFSPGAASGADSANLGTPAPGNTSGGGGLGGVSQNAWLGVLSAGLGMMGGTRADALGNIGNGAQEGLRTYLGLQQQDRNNAYRQSDIDLRVKQMEAEVANQQRLASYQSATLANDTARTNSEVASRNAATAAARYSRTFIPSQGWMVTDLTDPTKPPQMIPFAGQGSPDASAGASPPPITPAPQPSTSAPPPQGGVAASGVSPTPAGSAQPPASSGSTSPAGFGAGWRPTTAVPQGYVPPNQAGIYMNPGLLKGEQENATKTIDSTRNEAQAGGALQMRLDEMDRQYAQLPKTGLLAPGQAATARADLAKGINTFATAMGAQAPYDPNALAANENLVKDRFRLGADLARQMGGREPGFIVEQAVKANPGADNTPLAYQRITAGLRAATQYQQDRSAFFDDYNAKFGHLNGAQQAFDQLNPPQAYADRAVISTVDPRDLGVLRQNANNPAALSKFDQLYGQGTASLALRPLTVTR